MADNVAVVAELILPMALRALLAWALTPALVAGAGTAPVAPAALSPAHEIALSVNQARREFGLPPLKIEPRLALAAQSHAEDMAARGYFDHCAPEGHGPSERAAESGYPAAIWENCALGHEDARDAVKAWLESEGHRTTLLSPSLREMGAGRSGRYWVLDCSARSGVYPIVIENDSPIVRSRRVALYLHGQNRVNWVRLSNDGATYSPWMPYQPELEWELSEGAGPKTVYYQAYDGKVRTMVDEIYLAR